MNISSSAQTKQSVFQGVIAHRGSRLQAPENTMSSFTQAVADGANGVELDVQMSAGGEFVVLHDDTLERTTDSVGRADEMSLTELKKLDAGSWFDGKFEGERLPTLAESLTWAKEHNVTVDIEVKKSAAKVIKPQALVEAIRANDMEGRAAVSSFDRDFVEALELQAPEIETGVLVSGKPTFKKAGIAAAVGFVAGVSAGLLSTGSVLTSLGLGVATGLTSAALGTARGIQEVKNVAKTTSADALLPHWSVATKSTIATAKEHGKSVVPYTVNKEKTAERLIKNGVDGLVTDRPEFFSRAFV